MHSKLLSSRRDFILKSALLAGSFASPSLFASATNQSPRKVGVVLDPLFYKHDREGHPESAQRLRAIDNELTRRNLWRHFHAVKARMATQDELLSAHEGGYIFEIATLSESNAGYVDSYSEDTYVNQYSYDAARMAAGGNIELNLAVYDRKLDYGLGLLRPPGHHANARKAMGFCLFNSDVIAARALQRHRGVKRVAIIDFDVHHGNGTQDLTLKDPSIMAISIHQHPYWPMTGFANAIGEGAAKGTNVNLPFLAGAGDTTYLAAYDSIIAPKLRQFKPEHIIVFAGYDSHWRDPLAGHRVSVAGFNALVQRCLDSAEALCGGRISFTLGGGYEPEALGHCVAGTSHTLLGLSGEFKEPLGASPDKEEDFSRQLAELETLHLG